MQSDHNTCFVAPSSARSSPAPARGPSHEIESFTNCSSVNFQRSAVQEQLHHGPFPWAVVLQEQTAPAWVPCRPQFSPDSLLHSGLFSMGCSFLYSILVRGVMSSTGCSVNICAGVALHGLQVDRLVHHGHLDRIQENLLQYLEHLLLHRPLCLQSFLSQFSDFSCTELQCSIFYPFLVIIEVQPALLTGSALANSRSV